MFSLYQIIFKRQYQVNSMDYPVQGDLNNLQKLLSIGHLQHENIAQDGLHKSEIPQEINNAPDRQKKKGRPKGLKTNKAKIQKKAENNPCKNKGHWLYEQNKKYHWFLEIHSQHFIQKKLRRMDKIFKTMADFIGSREAEQCRSHHQKMQKKFRTFYKILKNLRLQFYSLADPDYVKRDFESNRITEYDPLISEQKLEDQNECQADNSKEQFHGDYELGPSKNQNEHKMLMSDCYERQFRL